jgi:DNA-binding Lrp family transcriptional regulator
MLRNLGRQGNQKKVTGVIVATITAMLRHAAVLQCFTTAGQADYLMHVLVAGIRELDSLLRMEISQMPGVLRIETTVCMTTIKHRTDDHRVSALNNCEAGHQLPAFGLMVISPRGF